MATANLPYYVIFGNVRLLKAYCAPCRRYAFVIDQELQCCGLPSEATAQAFKAESPTPPGKGQRKPHWALVGTTRRSTRSAKRKPPVSYQQTQLDRQCHKCIYCARNFGEVVTRKGKAVALRVNWDHFVPFAYLQSNPQINFVAACHICNGMKAMHCFETIEDARVYILHRWSAKGYV